MQASVFGKRTVRRVALLWAAAPCACFASVALAQTPAGEFQGLGFVGGGGSSPYSFARAVSADGAVVVGDSANASNQHEAFRWSGGVMSGLGFVGGGGSSPSSYSSAVSADGAVVVGYSRNASNQYEAFRWSGGVMNGLGFVGGGGSSPYSFARAVSADGAVVVGDSANASNQREAFRWSGGVMSGLGFVGGGGSSPSSYPSAVSADGAVVVGYSRNASNQTEAFRWSGGVMSGLGFIGGGGSSPSSNASAVSADGAVVVGGSSNASNRNEAFRWSGGVMSGLGFIGGGGSSPSSIARAVSADGAVVVGISTNASNRNEAFRWSGGVMSGLGFVGGGGSLPSSNASAVSADGAVVVGDSANASNQTEAFRWTEPTGIRSLRGLLADAGVTMGTWSLVGAVAVSANGEFIAGQGIDPNGRPQTYLVRYRLLPPTPPVPPSVTPPGQTPDPAPEPTPIVIAGMTTAASVQASVNQLAQAQQRIGVHQHGFAAPLLGNMQGIGSGSEIGAFGMAGSAAGGAQSRKAFGNGFSFQGGIAYMQEDYRDVQVRDAFLVAGSLRYVMPNTGLRPFGEIGGWITPSATFRFSRDYANGLGLARGRAETDGSLYYGYGRAGLAFNPTVADEFAISGEIGFQRLDSDAYFEQISPANPFEAYVSRGSQSFGVAKLRGQWTHTFSDQVDATLWLAGASSFADKQSLRVSVPGFGTMEPGKLPRSQWLEYGVRLGYKVSQSLTVDAFVSGTSGWDRIGTRVHGGLGIRTSF